MELEIRTKPTTVWTDKKKYEAVKILGTMHVSDVARCIGISEKRLLSACSRFKWSYAFNKAVPVSKLTDNQKFFIKRYAGVKSVKQIAEELGVKQTQIRNYAYNRKFSLRLPSSYSVHSYIPDKDINLMRDLFDSGVSAAEISRKFEISSTHAWEVCTFRARVDVLPDDFRDSNRDA